ncbi:MAG: hypothetical protein A3J76_00605 [Candidatus Moranbacteria bacterium RBG_13_45_13]|nr:MAG: hypothetical protein A3J76_00605 [Candidatus Moranbacteria bacterium RBG_13_45_13]
MKILLINKFYHDKGKAGGVGRHILELQKLLEKNGHEVIPFAMRQKETEPNDYLEFFPEEFELGEIKFNFKGLKNVFKIFYNREAVRKLERIVRKTKPDVAHIHNIYHHLSPAILPVLKKYRIPVVMTVHDYKLICPNYLLFSKGKVCEKCANGKYYKCFTNKCVKNSYAASLVLTLEAYFVKVRKYYQNNVDLFIVPSRFMREKIIENGFDGEKIRYLPNFFETARSGIENNNVRTEKYFLYFGRLSKEKGVDVLIKSLRYVDLKDYKLKIAGSGSEKRNLKSLAKSIGSEDKVEFLGYQSGKKLNDLISAADFVAVPSVWYENAPYSILESYAFGKPVIGARIGGIPELIKQNETGATFECGDERDLAEKIVNFIGNEKSVREMGQRGFEYLQEKFNGRNFYQELLKMYNEVVKK